MLHQLVLSNLKPALIIAAIGLLTSQYAAADSIALQGFYGGEANGTITLTKGTNYHTGATNVSFSEGAGIGGFLTKDLTTGKTFESWCVDVFHDFNFGNPGSTTDNLVTAKSLFGQTKATQMGELYTEFKNIQNASSSSLYDPAFQVALWAVVTNTSNSAPTLLPTSNFNTVFWDNNTALTAEVNTLLGGMSSTKSKYTANVWSVQGNSIPTGGSATSWGAQDVVVFAAVPEPESYAMMLAGLGLMGFMARSKKSA